MILPTANGMKAPTATAAQRERTLLPVDARAVMRIKREAALRTANGAANMTERLRPATIMAKGTAIGTSITKKNAGAVQVAVGIMRRNQAGRAEPARKRVTALMRTANGLVPSQIHITTIPAAGLMGVPAAAAVPGSRPA